MPRTPPERLKKRSPEGPVTLATFKSACLSDLVLAPARKTLLEIRQSCTRLVTEPRLDLAHFGACLNLLRKDAGLSLREVGKHLNLSAAFLCDVEYGRRNLKLSAQVRYIDLCLREGKKK